MRTSTSFDLWSFTGYAKELQDINNGLRERLSGFKDRMLRATQATGSYHGGIAVSNETRAAAQEKFISVIGNELEVRYTCLMKIQSLLQTFFDQHLVCEASNLIILVVLMGRRPVASQS